MRLTDLLGSEVRDERDESIGRVEDVRVVQDGPILGSFGAAYRVRGLLVGGWSVGFRLGFGRAAVRGPLPLKLLFGRLARRARFVEWERVRAVENGVIRIAGTASELGPPPLPGP